MAADLGRRAHLGGERRRGGPPPGRALAAGGGEAGRAARPPGDLPARQPDRPRDGPPPPGRRPALRAGVRARRRRSCGSPRRPRRTRACCPTSRRARSPRAPTSRSSPAPESLDSLTLDGPARPRDARPPPRGADPGAARRGGPGAVPPGPRAARRVAAPAPGSGTRPAAGTQPRASPGPPYNRAMPSDIRVRIAPSPTGPLHIGTARTALFNYLFARHTGGTFVLRLEDTDVARSTAAFEKDILDGLHWLGITWDEGPGVGRHGGGGAVRPVPPDGAPRRLRGGRAATSSRRTAPTRATARPRSSRRTARPRRPRSSPSATSAGAPPLTPAERAAREAEGRRGALRFRVRPGVVGWDDLVRDRVEIDTANLGGDFVIVRGDGNPLYHFTVVVDDMAMRISHVIRGEDHVSNTPKHILLFEALGYPLPGLRPPAAHPQPGRDEDEQAQEPDRGRGLRGPGVPARGARQLLRVPGLVAGHGGGRPHARRDRRRASSWTRSRRAAPASTASASSGSTASGSAAWTTRTSSSACCRSSRRRRSPAQIDRAPGDDELRALLPIVRERIPTLAAIVDTAGFLWVDDLAVDPGGPRPEALGRGHDTRGPRRRARASSPRTTP